MDFTPAGDVYRPEPSETYFARRRHLHVAQLYARVLPRITEDLVLTLEDDIEPPLDAARRLGEEIGYPPATNIAAVASAYSMPEADGFVCAGIGPNGWGNSVSWHALPWHPIDVVCVGGGCTVWANWALRSLPAHVEWDRGLGWDGVLCTELQRRGFSVRLHGAVRSVHHLHARVDGSAGQSVVPAITPRPAPPWTIATPGANPDHPRWRLLDSRPGRLRAVAEPE
jgi:hypothetical protein